MLGPEGPVDPLRRELGLYGILLAAALLIAAAVVLIAAVPVVFAAGGLIGLAYLLLCARRPVWGCAALVLATPLIEGMGRGTVIPLVRPSEAMMALLIVGILAHEIPRRAPRNFVVMDVAILAYALGATVLPVLYVVFTGQAHTVDTATTFNIFSPLQYLAIYLLFSRVGVTDRDRRLFLNLAMAGSVVVSLVGMAELANLPGVQAFLSAYYPTQGEPNTICMYGVCRPNSLMQHYSAFGAYSVLSYTIALALLAGRRAGFNARWLVFVLAVNAMGVFVSETVAAVVGLGLVTVVVLIHRGSFPKQLLYVATAVVIGTVIFWGPISARIEQQFPFGDQKVAGLPVPESMEVRGQYWTQIFWPALQPVIWTGTGDQVPDEVPQSLVPFVDNEYLAMGFRAGVSGDVLLIVMLGVVGVAGWRARRSGDPLEAALGAMAVAYVLVLAVMGTTAEYLSFAGVDQAFWMVIGMVAGYRVLVRRESSPYVELIGGAPEPASERLSAPPPGRVG